MFVLCQGCKKKFPEELCFWIKKTGRFVCATCLTDHTKFFGFQLDVMPCKDGQAVGNN